MKCTKRVDSNGRINVEFKNLPEMPVEGMWINAYGASGPPKYLALPAIVNVQHGDFTWNCDDTLNYTDDMRASEIAKIVLARFTELTEAWHNFVAENTEEVEIINNPVELTEILRDEKRLYYQSNDGEMVLIK